MIIVTIIIVIIHTYTVRFAAGDLQIRWFRKSCKAFKQAIQTIPLDDNVGFICASQVFQILKKGDIGPGDY